jgi:hypothetical protein
MIGHRVFELVFISLFFNLVVQSQDNILPYFLVSFGQDRWRNNILVFFARSNIHASNCVGFGKMAAHLVAMVPLYLS